MFHVMPKNSLKPQTFVKSYGPDPHLEGEVIRAVWLYTSWGSGPRNAAKSQTMLGSPISILCGRDSQIPAWSQPYPEKGFLPVLLLELVYFLGLQQQLFLQLVSGQRVLQQLDLQP